MAPQLSERDEVGCPVVGGLVHARSVPVLPPAARARMKAVHLDVHHASADPARIVVLPKEGSRRVLGLKPHAWKSHRQRLVRT